MKISDLSKDDYRFIEKNPKGFNPERNKAIIEGVIKKHEDNIFRKKKDYAERVAERANAVVSYLHSRTLAHGGDIEEFLGRRELARLQGQRILKKAKRLASGKEIIELEEL